MKTGRFGGQGGEQLDFSELKLVVENVDFFLRVYDERGLSGIYFEKSNLDAKYRAASYVVRAMERYCEGKNVFERRFGVDNRIREMIIGEVLERYLNYCEEMRKREKEDDSELEKKVEKNVEGENGEIEEKVEEILVG